MKLYNQVSEDQLYILQLMEWGLNTCTGRSPWELPRDNWEWTESERMMKWRDEQRRDGHYAFADLQIVEEQMRSFILVSDPETDNAVSDGCPRGTPRGSDIWRNECLREDIRSFNRCDLPAPHRLRANEDSCFLLVLDTVLVDNLVVVIGYKTILVLLLKGYIHKSGLSIKRRKMKQLSRSIWIIVCLCATIASAEWSQWRGQNRDGILTQFSAPEVWPKQLKKLWHVELGSGDASPIVVEGRIYTHTRQNQNEVVTALDLKTGEMLWQNSYGPVPYMWPWHGAESRGQGPFSTPVFHDGIVYALGIAQALSAFDAETGQLLWRKDFKKHLGFGSSTSPIVESGYCIVHVGDPKNGALTAFDARTGEVAWQWTEDGPSYASPICVEFEGIKQLVALTRKYCIGISPTTGKLYWKTPFEQVWDETVP